MKDVLELLEKATILNSDKVALRDKDNTIKYCEMRRWARNIGYSISKKTNKIRNPIIVVSDRNIETVVALMGVLYSGNFYVSVSHDMPSNRIRLLLEKVRPCLIVLTEKYRDKFIEYDIPLHVIEEDWKLHDVDFIDERINDIINQIVDVDVAYMVMTSGSTGVPKSVVKTHRSILSFLEAFTRVFEFTSEDVLANQAPFDFDVSAKDIYLTLYLGATLNIIPHVCFMIPDKLGAFLKDREVTVLIWAASAVKLVAKTNAFSRHIPTTIKKVFFSGEPMQMNVINKWRESLPMTEYINLYAPSEVTGNCLYHVINNEEKIPLGKAFPNIDVLVLNENNEPIKEHEKGEVFVRGSFVASGYFADMDKTKNVFIQNPTHNDYIDLVYKTGDLVEKIDGKIYFLSRADYQVKYRGHRIELGEIESAAEKITGVFYACAFVDVECDEMVLIVEAKDISEIDIYNRIRQYLPKYMTPSKICIWKAVPQTSHNKMDRNKIKEIYMKGKKNEGTYI